jgi:hypothetical protein
MRTLKQFIWPPSRRPGTVSRAHPVCLWCVFALVFLCLSLSVCVCAGMVGQNILEGLVKTAGWEELEALAADPGVFLLVSPRLCCVSCVSLACLCRVSVVSLRVVSRASLWRCGVLLLVSAAPPPRALRAAREAAQLLEPPESLVGCSDAPPPPLQDVRTAKEVGSQGPLHPKVCVRACVCVCVCE